MTIRLPTPTRLLLRFGAYELDPQAHELYKYDTRMPLQEQPMRVLLLLVEHHGRLVTREQLREQLWPNAATGDFDHGLNNAVNRLREVLCDSAEEPRFIETLPKRGYRFIATVEIPTAESMSPLAPEAPRMSAAATPFENVRRRRWHWMAAGVLLVAGGWLALQAWLAQASSVQPIRVTRLTSAPDLEDSPQWAADGQSVTYVSDAAGNLDIYRQPWPTGEAIRLVDSDADDAQPAWSPDGAWLAFVSARGRSDRRLLPLTGFGAWYSAFLLRNGDIWLMRADGSAPRRLAEDAYYPAWSPDGGTLVYAALRQGKWALVLQEVNTGAEPVTLSLGAAFEARVDPVLLQPAWSPDGRWIVFVVGRGPYGAQLFVVPSRGGNAEPLTDGERGAMSPGWSPDGRWLYFAMGSPYGKTSLYRARFLHGALEKPEQVVPGDPEVLSAAVHPSGTRIAYLRSQRTADIWEYEVASGRLARITSEGTREDNSRLSPDGNWLAFASDRLGGTHIWLLDRRTGNLSQVSSVTNGEILWSSSHWSRDGKYLYYSRGNSVWRYDMNTRTSEVVSEGAPYCPSADGSSLFVVLNTHTISRIELASGRKVELVRIPAGALVDLELSPDGKWLAFHTHHDVDRDIWVMGADGSNPHPLTQDENEDAHPAWAADSRSIYFVRNHRDIYVVPRTGGEPRRVTHLGSSISGVDYPSMSADGRRLLFTRSGRVGDIHTVEHRPE